MRVIVFGLMFLLSIASSALAEDRCKDVLANGVWEYHLGISDTHNVSAFLNWYGSTNSGRSGETKKQSLTGGVVYDGVPVSIGLSNDQQQNNEFFSKLEKLNAGYDQYDSTVVNFVKSASAVIVKAWSDCMSVSEGGGVRVSLKFTENPRDLILDLRFRPIDNNTRQARISLDLPAFIKCAVPGGGRNLTIGNVGTIVRCTRANGDPGAILINSDTQVLPEKTLRFFAALIRDVLTGKPYARCDVFEDVRNGQDTLGEPEQVLTGDDFGGGGIQSRHLALEVPIGFRLANVVPHCVSLDQDACRFVRTFEPQNVQWTIPGRRAEFDPSTDGGRATISVTGTKQQVISGTQRIKHPLPLALAYGRNFSVEFPTSATDVKLYCNATGSQRIFSMSDLQKEGDQIYLRAVRNSSTGRIMDLAVAPFDLER
jgi:hypothetical protein